MYQGYHPSYQHHGNAVFINQGHPQRLQTTYVNTNTSFSIPHNQVKSNQYPISQSNLQPTRVHPVNNNFDQGYHHNVNGPQYPGSSQINQNRISRSRYHQNQVYNNMYQPNPHHMQQLGPIKQEKYANNMKDITQNQQILSQQLEFPLQEVSYKIMPAEQDRMSLDVTTIDNAQKGLQKNTLIIWDYHGGPNQRFYFKKCRQIPIPGSKKTRRFFYIYNASTGYALDVPDQSTQNDVKIIVDPPNKTRGQQWQLIECGKDLYQIKSFCGKLLDIRHHWIRNGNDVVQYEDNNGKNQKWKIYAG